MMKYDDNNNKKFNIIQKFIKVDCVIGGNVGGGSSLRHVQYTNVCASEHERS